MKDAESDALKESHTDGTYGRGFFRICPKCRRVASACLCAFALVTGHAEQHNHDEDQTPTQKPFIPVATSTAATVVGGIDSIQWITPGYPPST